MADVMHPIRVASNFSLFSEEFWLALCHDGVEDGYLPRFLCRWWPALDAITRRSGETYRPDYLRRVYFEPVARRVKIADLLDNLYGREFPPGRTLADRYHQALAYLQDF